MNKRMWMLLVILFAALALLAYRAQSSRAAQPPGVERLESDSQGPVELTWNPLTGRVSFLRAAVPVERLGVTSADGPQAAALAFAGRYADLLGLEQPAAQLQLVQTETDALGLQHVRLAQVYQGAPVYGAELRLHLAPGGGAVVAAGSGMIPAIRLESVQARVGAQQAVENARLALPGSLLEAPARLVIYPGRSADPGAAARLVWLVALRDDSLPARSLYVIDAIDGVILDVLDRLYESRNRLTYNANNGTSLPGTLARSEGQGPVGDADIDAAHDFAGETYDYYFNTHGRDSYDNAGATLVSTANYGSNYANAFWNGVQMVYGDGFAVEDVVGHELTHAVTERTANLEYRWQSGALNESFSDIFGAMIDREDWLMGEDLPPEAIGGLDAIRDMADPARLNQPAHTADWVQTCSDNEGVHINSGIFNKAYYNIATAITKDKAELVFYRALTVYLGVSSSMEDGRAAALQAASDLYGGASPEYSGVQSGFNAVGLDGVWQPPANSCTCAAATALADPGLSTLQTAGSLYRLRDRVLDASPAGEHYRRLYETHTGRISALLLAEGDLRRRGGALLAELAPSLAAFSAGEDREDILTAGQVAAVQAYLRALAAADRERSGGALAEVIEREMARIDWPRLVGMSYAQAWEYIRAVIEGRVIYLPVLVGR